MSPRGTTPLLLAGLMVVLACDFGEISVADPPPAPSTAEVILQVRAEEPEATEPFGWADGRVPGAAVTLVPEDTTRAERWEGETGPDGTITFDEVPLARYVARVVRALTFDEFEAAEREIGGFAGMEVFTVESARAEVEVPALISRRRGIVLSEYYDSERFVPGVGTYSKGDFLEFYNNSDSTVYLDRLVVGKAFDIGRDYGPRPCSMFEHLRNDPQGVWARYFHQFPGSGTDYPLSPGQVIVIATQAIDHNEYAEGEPDLSGADYEFAGGPNNPAVPDLPDIGLTSWPGGLDFTGIAGVPFVSRPEEVGDLPLDREPDTGREYVRFPIGAIQEVGSFLLRESSLGYPPCPQLVHGNFDGGYSTVTPWFEYLLSNQRKVLLILPDGREVLQDTDWSELDFMWADRTPGALPSTPGD